MNLNLTWDLFIIVFFALVITYSMIIGKHQSVKIIVATYIAIVAVQGITNIIERLTGETEPLLTVLGLTIDNAVLTAVKLAIFIAIIIFFAVRGGLEVAYTKEPGTTMNLILTALFGAATAGLLLSTLLTFVLNIPLLQSETTIEKLGDVAGKSKLLELMVWNLDLWFSLPALLILAVGFMSNDDKDSE